MSAKHTGDTKWCKKCDSVKPVSEFSVSKYGTPKTYCKPCMVAIASAWAKRPENRNRVLANYRRANRSTRDDVFDVYGKSCACCGEDRREFLVIDHKDGGGNKHRQEIGQGGSPIAYWLKRNGFPDGFQTLCQNCNFAKTAFGECPHQRERRKHNAEPMTKCGGYDLGILRSIGVLIQ